MMVDLGMGYLTLSRPVGSLSNGEAQRLKLSRQLTSSLSDLLYILDEPTAGLHAKDADTIAGTLRQLVEKGNSVLVVEHDRNVISKADHIIEMGPFAGRRGGQVVFTGTYEQMLGGDTLTAKAFRERSRGSRKRRKPEMFIEIEADRNNIHNLRVNIPLQVLTCITGVSGSGKSTLIQELVEQYPDCITVDQSRIGMSSRSTPITYVDGFTDIRREFAKVSGETEAMFAFNSKGACPKCKGLGYQLVNMHFLGDMKQLCEECGGKRYSEEVLQYRYQGKNIAEVLEMTVDEALEFFAVPSIRRKIEMLQRVGLGYLTLGQPFDTLSGGEAQRIKLVSGLSKSGNTFILDEPTRGLHPYDVQNLMKVLNYIVDHGNTVIVVEHNLDVIEDADHIIDLGPEGGKKGGQIVAQGSPEEIMKCRGSHTGQYLAERIS